MTDRIVQIAITTSHGTYEHAEAVEIVALSETGSIFHMVQPSATTGWAGTDWVAVPSPLSLRETTD